MRGRRWAAALAAALMTALPGVASRAAPAPAHTYTVWRVERVDAKARPLKMTIGVAEAKPGSFFGDVNLRRVGQRYVPYRAIDNAVGYGFMYEQGRQTLVPTADVNEGPAHATTPTCTDLGIDSCTAPGSLGLASTMTPGSVGWLTDKPINYDFYAVLYDMKPRAAPTFDKKYPGWRAVPVRNVSVTVVTRGQAEATGATDGYYNVEHFHRATVTSGRGYSVVQAILPCLGTSGPGVGSAQLTNTRGLTIQMDCNHPIYVAAAAAHTDWTLSGDVVGVNQQAFPYSRLIKVDFPG
jgi:hypothetical protein